MNLNKRMLFVIGPVVLASYLLGMIGIFQLQKSLTLQAETNRAELQLSNLQTQYLNYKLAIDNILLAVREGNVLYRFLENPEDIYRNRALTMLLERVLGRLETKNSKIINVSILNPDQTQEFYFESSLNPFAEIHSEQLSFGREQWAKAKVDRHRLIGITKGPALIVVQDRFDRRTLRESMTSESDKQIILQVAVSPDRFWSELRKMEQDLHSTVTLGATPFAAEPGRLQVSLAENLHASILINMESVDRQLQVVKLWMVFAGVLLGAVSFGLLYWLIRRFVTRPIQVLESQLEEVERSKGASLPRMESQDEVGRLSRRFAETYEALLKAYDKARFLAEVDLLTNLPNRAYFSGWVDAALIRPSTQPEKLALLYIDLDNFKYVNDKYGHQTGDALLQKFSLRLSRTITAFTQNLGAPIECFGARLAGDEFAVGVQGDAALPTAQQLAEQILALFSNGFSFEKGVFPVTASIGIVVYPRDGVTLTQLVSNADSAMYQAKAAGKNCISTFSLALAREARRVRAYRPYRTY
ncbi:MAG: diguanylate cyclase [Hahellaceae bacterium]|nr:diguanylate cyclase [Hahellaceae bacterium]